MMTDKDNEVFCWVGVACLVICYIIVGSIDYGSLTL